MQQGKEGGGKVGKKKILDSEKWEQKEHLEAFI